MIFKKGFFIKTIGKIVVAFIVLLVTLQVACYIAFQFPSVQTWAGKKVIESVSDNINGKISIDKIYIVFFNKLIIKDISIVSTDKNPALDSLKASFKQSDTLLSCQKLSVSLDPAELIKLKLKLKDVRLSNGVFNLQSESESSTNIDRIFKLEKNQPKDTTKKSSINLLANSLKISNFRFTLNNPFKYVSKGDSIINFADLNVSKIYVNISDVHLKADTLFANINNISGEDKSGFKLAGLTGKARVCSTEAIVNNFSVGDSYSTINAKYFYMKYNSPKDLSEFVTKVKMGILFDDSHFNLRTIGKIAPSLYSSRLSFFVNGKVSGKVSDITTKDLVVTSESGQTFLELQARLIGLPDITKTIAIADVDKCYTTSNDIANIIASLNNSPKNPVILNLAPFIRYNFVGGFSGLLNDFVANGVIQSSVGKVNLDVLFKTEPQKNGIRFNGNVATQDLNIGKIISNKSIGEVTLKTSLNALISNGPSKSLDVTIDSVDIKKLGFNNYNYSNIFAIGKYTDKYFDGRIICHDPNLNFIFQGFLSFNKEAENKYNFYANVPYANLAALNIDKRDSVSTLSLVTTANFTQYNVSDMDGDITVKNLSYKNSRGQFKIGSINLLSKQADNTYKAILNAPFAKAEYSGASPLTIFVKKVLSQVIYDRLPNVFNKDEQEKIAQKIKKGKKVKKEKVKVEDTQKSKFIAGNYKFKLKTFNTMGICELLYPGLYIMDSTSVDISLDKDNDFKALAKSGRIAMRANYLKDFELQVNNKDSLETKAKLFAKNIRVAGIRMDSSSINITADTNRLDANFNFKNDSTGNNNANLAATVLFKPFNRKEIYINDNSKITLNGEDWNFMPAVINVTDSLTHIDNFSIENINQKLNVDGYISKYENDTLNVKLSNFNVGIFNLFLSKSFDLEGYFSGEGMVSDLNESPKVVLNLSGDSVSVFKNPVGTMKIQSDWSNIDKRLNLLLNTELNNKTTLNATGYYKPDSTYLNLNASLDELSVSYFEPFLSDIISKTKGTLSGDLKLSGPFDKLRLRGENCAFKDFNFTVNFTNVPYTLNGPISLDEHGVNVKRLSIKDKYGAQGYVNGGLSYNYFKDIKLNTRIDFSNFQCLDTKEKDNEAFYGNAFATGYINITGPLNKIKMDINILSNARTSIHIPLSSSSTANQTNLLTFVEPVKDIWFDPYDTLSINKKTSKSPTELDIKLRANVTPQAEILIEINKSVGDIIKANGNGLINMNINPSKERFDIFGDYNITKGNYKFVFAGFAAKDFIIQPGGTINFNGAIDNTILNLTAIYQTKASINTLIADTSGVAARRTVDCQINMAGHLMNPELNFNIDIPDLDPTTKIRVESALNTQGKIQKQFMALLVSGGFIPDEQSGIANNSSILYSNASEILSNQINMIFQQLGIPIDLGLNYQHGDKGTDIFDVAVSTQLFNNRVLINGNIGNDPYASSNRSVIGNIDVEVKLDNTGNLRLNLFSHAEDQFSAYTENANSQRSGVGLTYQKEFNTFRELFRKKSQAQKEYEKRKKEIEKGLRKKEREEKRKNSIIKRDR